jgi:serine/threonine-protein kinase SRPK3
MIELLDHMPRHIATAGKNARDFFTREGRLRHISRLHYWPVDRVLQEKYHMAAEEVRARKK